MNQKAFAVILQDLRDGRVHAELSQQFHDLVAKVKETGKAGELTFKIKIKPATRGADVDKITVSDVISIALPKPERGEDMYFLTEEGELSRNHPKQQELALRDVITTTPNKFKEA